jgi:hypothetical protein
MPRSSIENVNISPAVNINETGFTSSKYGIMSRHQSSTDNNASSHHITVIVTARHETHQAQHVVNKQTTHVQNQPNQERNRSAPATNENQTSVEETSPTTATTFTQQRNARRNTVLTRTSAARDKSGK